MKELMNLKFQMHKGVNYLFYAIVIVIGVLIGLGIKNIGLFNIDMIKEFIGKIGG